MPVLTDDEIRALLDGATPGPWGWFGQAKHNQVYLATRHSGRRYVMDFVRWGMQHAQPRFQTERGVMIDAKDLLEFEVGNQSVRGVEAAKKDASVYRLDVRGIDAPDARLIASAPDLAAEVLRLREALRKCLGFIENTESEFGIELDSGIAARAALKGVAQ